MASKLTSSHRSNARSTVLAVLRIKTLSVGVRSVDRLLCKISDLLRLAETALGTADANTHTSGRTGPLIKTNTKDILESLSCEVFALSDARVLRELLETRSFDAVIVSTLSSNSDPLLAAEQAKKLQLAARVLLWGPVGRTNSTTVAHLH